MLESTSTAFSFSTAVDSFPSGTMSEFPTFCFLSCTNGWRAAQKDGFHAKMQDTGLDGRCVDVLVIAGSGKKAQKVQGSGLEGFFEGGPVGFVEGDFGLFT